MAKDPAVLWYWNDWQGGTATISRHLKGCYMDLLHAQFNNGRLSLAQVKTVLGVDFGNAWPLLQEKFKKDDNGNYYNMKAEVEKVKRQKYSESRSKNKKGKISTHDPTYDFHMENENSVLVAGIKKDKWYTTPGPESMSLELPEIKQGVIVELFLYTKNKKITNDQVLGLWKIFKVQNFCSEKFYQSVNQVYKHFINWCKTQNIESSTENGRHIPTGPTLQKL